MRTVLSLSAMSGNIEDILRTMEAEYGLLDETEDDTETKKLMDIWATSDISEADDIYQKLDKENSEEEDIEELKV